MSYGFLVLIGLGMMVSISIDPRLFFVFFFLGYFVLLRRFRWWLVLSAIIFFWFKYDKNFFVFGLGGTFPYVIDQLISARFNFVILRVLIWMGLWILGFYLIGINLFDWLTFTVMIFCVSVVVFLRRYLLKDEDSGIFINRNM